MAKSINASDLAAAIAAELESYSQEVTDGMKKEVEKVAKSTVKRLKKTSPKSKNGGDYAKGWTAKVAYEGKEDIRINVHNKKKPQLTHLLEHGHAKVNDGRVEGRPHIAPAEKQAEKELVGKVKVVIQNR